jgi:hypothetical protein
MAVSTFDCDGSLPELAAPVKIEVSHLSTFMSSAASANTKTQEVASKALREETNRASKVPQKIPMKEDQENEIYQDLSDENHMADQQLLQHKIAEQEAVRAQQLAEREMLKQQFAAGVAAAERQLMLAGHFAGLEMCPPFPEGWWPSADGWMGPEGWVPGAPWMDCWSGWPAPWQDFATSPPGTWHPLDPPVDQVSTLADPGISDMTCASEGPVGICAIAPVDGVSTDISAESTEEGCTGSGFTSEEDCITPHRSLSPGQECSDGVQAGQELLALLKPEESEKSNGDLHSIDDMLLIKLEERESKESGADNWNEDTFGADTAEGWDFDAMLLANEALRCSQDRSARRLPPAPAELPPVPPTALAETHMQEKVLPPGLPVPPGRACSPELHITRDENVAPPPGLSLRSNSGSDADISDAEPQAPPADCWTSWLSDDLKKNSESSAIAESVSASTTEATLATPAEQQIETDDNVTAIPGAQMEMTPQEDVDAFPDAVDVRPQPAPAACMPTATVLSAHRTKAPNKPSSTSDQGTQQTPSTTSGQKPNKLRTKARAEPRRPRSKIDATASADDAVFAEDADVDCKATEPSNRIIGPWFRMLSGAILVLVVFMMSFPGHFWFGSSGVDGGMPAESHSWAAALPREADAHVRSQQVASVVKNMGIEIARANAVASYVKSKAKETKKERKLRQQQEAAMKEHQEQMRMHHQHQMHPMHHQMHPMHHQMHPQQMPPQQFWMHPQQMHHQMHPQQMWQAQQNVGVQQNVGPQTTCQR